MFIKLFCSPSFDTAGFVEMLTRCMNVPALETEGGVILDRDAFNAYPVKWLSRWACMNRKDINNPLRTRPAAPDEIPYEGFRYQGSLILNRGTYYISGAHTAEEVLNEMLSLCPAMKQKYGEDYINAYVYDQFTGANIYEVRA